VEGKKNLQVRGGVHSRSTSEKHPSVTVALVMPLRFRTKCLVTLVSFIWLYTSTDKYAVSFVRYLGAKVDGYVISCLSAQIKRHGFFHHSQNMFPLPLE
jgi:hypothetical protein